MRVSSLLATVILSVMVQGCTVTYLKLRDEIPNKTSAERTNGCDFNYSFTMDDYRRFRTIGNQPNPRAQEALQKYTQATQAVFFQRGCRATSVEDRGKAEFNIDIVRAPQLSALPQEWLTGLTLGAIPSWGTRYGEFQYTFTTTPTKKSFTYFVDRPAFNHIILFPIFWLSFYGTDEIGLYKRALTNFLDNS